MKTLPEPRFGALEVLESCASRLHDAGLVARLRAAAPTVGTAEADYRRLGSAAQLYEINAEPNVGGHVSTDEMIKLYKGTLSRSNSRSRHYYDSLKLSAPNDICPLCCQRVVKTLDHYLPKTGHPALAVTPLNLVPACSDCNKHKLDRIAANAREQTLHPYFDDVSSDRWLAAEVMESSPPAAVYFVRAPATWDAVLRDRLTVHFQTFGLGELYAAQSGAEMVSIRYALAEASSAGGADGVMKFLQQQARARSRADQNSWVAVLYAALSESMWFCNVGFARLGSVA